MVNGRLYGVSTGPGDPELITLKALRCLEKTPVIASPRTMGGNTMALDIIKEKIDISQKEILYLDFAMKKEASILEQTHRMQANQIEEYLRQGKDVAMLNIGDASLFGTYGYLRDLIREDGFETTTIPGVPSFCAVAAELEWSLTTMGEPLTIIPGSFDGVEEALERPGTKVLMKSGNALGVVKETLRDKGKMEHSAMVVNCGLPNQRVFHDIEKSSDDEGYFATILVKK